MLDKLKEPVVLTRYDMMFIHLSFAMLWLEMAFR